MKIKSPAAIYCLLLFVAALGGHLAFSMYGWNNHLLEAHNFRQAQTALTAYYFAREGFSIPYPLPVAGPPWTFPFEFPLYQIIVAWTHNTTGLGLDQAARAVSLFFFYLSLVPIYFIVRYLGFQRDKVPLFYTLYLTSPIYIYWPRTCMIETTALFFSLSFVASALVGQGKKSAAWHLAAMIFGLLAALVKFPTMCIGGGFLILCFAINWWREGRREPVFSQLKNNALLAAVVLIPFVTGWAWSAYAEQVRGRSPIMRSAPEAWVKWNFGTGAQRLEKAFWTRLNDYGINHVTGGMLPLGMALALLVMARRRRLESLALFGAFLSGPLVFANIFFVHNYYYCANAVFLLSFVAFAFSAAMEEDNAPRFWLALLFTSLPVINLITYFDSANYWVQSSNGNNSLHDFSLAVKEKTKPDDVLMICGHDWDPSIPYYSERRAVMIKFANVIVDGKLDQTMAMLQKEGRHLGAFILNEKDFPFPDLVDIVFQKYGFDRTPVCRDSENKFILYQARRNQE